MLKRAKVWRGMQLVCYDHGTFSDEMKISKREYIENKFEKRSGKASA
jgi:hypothetical protein